MNNMPEVKVGIVAVSRDCFPESLSVNRRKALVGAYAKKYDAKVFPAHDWEFFQTMKLAPKYYE